jgi:hypothetical protein
MNERETVRPRGRTPSSRRARALRGDTFLVVAWLQPLTVRSLQETRGDSDGVDSRDESIARAASGGHKGQEEKVLTSTLRRGCPGG